MDHETRVTTAIVDALATPAVPNGGDMRSPVRHLPKAAIPTKPVVEVRPPVHAWACEHCFTTGDDWLDMQAHVEATGHRSFTATP